MQRVLRGVWRFFWRLKTILMAFLLVGSLTVNVILFVGGSFFSVINNSFEALSGIQTLASRNTAEIASLSEEVVLERNAKRELKGQLRETSADLADTRITNGRLQRETRELSAELFAERKARRELKGQVAELSGDLIVERNTRRALKSQVSEQAAQLATYRVTNRQLKTQIRDFGMGIVPFRGKRVALTTAVDETADIIGERAVRTARREVASMPAEAIPYLGTAIIVGVTALEIYDLCATLKDMSALKRAFNADFEQSEEELEVCSMKVPPKEEIIAAVKGSPQKAWAAATAATPSWSELKQIDFPEVALSEMWDSTREGASGMLGNTVENINDLGDKLDKWWSAE